MHPVPNPSLFVDLKPIVKKTKMIVKTAGRNQGKRATKFHTVKHRQIGDPPSGEHPFDKQLVRDVDPAGAPNTLMFIGPGMTANLANENLNTLQEIIDYVKAHTRIQNTAMFKRVFVNAKYTLSQQQANPRLRCVGKRLRSGRSPHLYSVRPYNFNGWNALQYYLTLHIPPAERFIVSRRGVHSDRIPAEEVPRLPTGAFPQYC